MDPDTPLTAPASVEAPEAACGAGSPDAPQPAASGVIPQAAEGGVSGPPPRPLVVEVLDARGHQVRARLRLDRYPLTVGRAYSSDVILDDPYADPWHLRVEWDEARGVPVAVDLGSVNGTSEAGRADHVRQVALRPGTELRVGRTVLRFCDPDQPVPPAIPDRHRAEAVAAATSGTWLPWGRRLSPVSQPAAIGTCLAALALFGLSSYLESTERTNLAKIVSSTLFLLVPFAAWSGAWALGSRMAVHRFHFVQHLATVCAVGVGFMLLSALGEWLDFYFPEGTPSSVVGSALGFVLASGLIAGHLRFASHLPRARRWRAGVAVMVAVAAVAALDAYADRDDFTSEMSYSASLKPVGAARVPAMPLPRFGTELTEMKEELEEIAGKMEKEK